MVRLEVVSSWYRVHDVLLTLLTFSTLFRYNVIEHTNSVSGIELGVRDIYGSEKLEIFFQYKYISSKEIQISTVAGSYLQRYLYQTDNPN